MDIQLKKWGNSLGFRIPYKIAAQLGLEEDTIVELMLDENGLTLRKKLFPSTLDELLDSLPDNFEYPDDIADFTEGAPSGQELL